MLVTENRPKPFDPRCNRAPDQIEEYVQYGEVESMTPDEYVRLHEGTYNRENGHFLCTSCYIAIGMPSSPQGWVCP